MSAPEAVSTPSPSNTPAPVETPDSPTSTPAVPAITDNFTGLPEKYASDPDFSTYKSVDDVFGELKNLKAVQANREANGMLILPAADAPPEAWNDVYTKLGKPASPAEYELARPEGLPEGLDFSDEMLGEYATVAHELNLTKAQAQKLMEWKNSKDMEQYASFEAAKEATLEGNLAQLEELWGGKQDSPKFAENHKAATKAFNAVADQGLAEKFKADPFLASNPIVMETLARLGKMMSDDTVPSITDTIPVSKFGDSLSSVESQIQKFYDDGKFKDMMNSANPKHRQLRDEWKALNDKRREIMTKE